MSRGAAWMLYSYVAGFALQGLYFVLLARTLGPVEFGVYSGALAVASTAAAFAGLGSGNVLVMRGSRRRETLPAQLGTVWVYVLIAGPLLLGAALLAALPVGRDFMLTLLLVGAAELVFGRFSEAAMQSFQATDRLAITANLNVAAGALRLALVLPFLSLHDAKAFQWGVLYLVAAAMLAVTGSLLVLSRVGRPQFRRAIIASTWREGIPFAVGMSSRVLYMDADKYLLNLLGYESAAGHFSAATRLLTMASAPIQAVVYASNRQLFRAGEAGRAAVTPVLLKLLKFVIPYGVFAGIATVICAPVVRLVLGPEYAETSSLLVWLSPIVLLQGVHYAVGDALMGLGRQGPRSVVQLIVAVLSVAANLVLIPILGWQAVVVTALGSATVLAVVMVGMYVSFKAPVRRPLEVVHG